VIGYAEREIGRRSAAMFNLVTDAWLAAYPADIAMTNPGGFRQSLPAGEITLADVVGVLPFDNTLVDVTLTGAQVIASYEHGHPAIAGMTARGGYKLADGTPIDREAIYHVLVNDFMYAGGDGYKFNEYDPDAYFTSIEWRQPVIDWIIAQKTSADKPLDDVLDVRMR
jgi:2',3'-cyclic-nucleotide 2'-phosphodiesterase (5'-nucleotidase family)